MMQTAQKFFQSSVFANLHFVITHGNVCQRNASRLKITSKNVAMRSSNDMPAYKPHMLFSLCFAHKRKHSFETWSIDFRCAFVPSSKYDRRRGIMPMVNPEALRPSA
ncbi:hypothetical protein AVEN_245621-1 [Araneus ventricosus]|uniref:Uncharacterized protein n=1 Tax=Araneus ventricosus TaxID=182803 RepID=A0A4Y2UIK2_ARAVE|nr:hypothetical protein AVEN_28804-1 [Araneus ventricosus]GBO12718.1 hypothetical protein AVEN_245621-1 [Araneus ventricosus]